MPNATLLATVALLLAAVFLLGWYLGSVEPIELSTVLEAQENREWRRDIEFVTRTIAYARAAEAVCLWPHRIDRKADLARHIESLATAPELGTTTPNPEPVSDVEALPASPVSSAAPVLLVPIGDGDPLGFDARPMGVLSRDEMRNRLEEEQGITVASDTEIEAESKAFDHVDVDPLRLDGFL